MFNTDKEITLTILISTLLLLLFVIALIYFIFKYQRRRFQHQKKLGELKDTFNKILLSSKIEIQENTLNHISKELHSNIGQLASLININLSEILTNAEDKERESILETKSLVKLLLTELKAISTTLNTDYIMKIGFNEALKKELDRVSKSMKYPVVIEYQGIVFKLNPEREIILFRLCQEIINNIILYAKANKITVHLNYSEEFLLLDFKDDGVGFDIELAKQKNIKNNSTGMINMEKRANIIDANFNIISEVGKGTKVSLKVPKEIDSK